MFNLFAVPVPELAGKTILVTGAGRGIGAVLAGLLAGRGARVFAGIFGKPDPEWEHHLAGATQIELDVTRQDDVDHAIETIQSDAGRLDGLVNNAGLISPIGHVDQLSSDDLRPAFEVNVLGVHRMTRAALPMLRQASGVVVNAGTGAATTPMEGWAAYCTSKAGARMLTQMFAIELKDSGIRFFFLGIPPTDTAMQAEIRQAGLNPISRIAQSDLVAPQVAASAMAWLCSAEARQLEDVLLDVREAPFTTMMAG